MMRRDLDLNLLELYSSLNLDRKNVFSPIPKSYGLIKPGDLIHFKYDLSEEGIKDNYYRFCLVVRNQTGKIGYTSLRGNELLSCYRLNDTSSTLLSAILRELYQNRNKCSYDYIQKGLTWVLGQANYHTYMLRRMSRLEKILVNKKDLPEEE